MKGVTNFNPLNTNFAPCFPNSRIKPRVAVFANGFPTVFAVCCVSFCCAFAAVSPKLPNAMAVMRVRFAIFVND